MNKRIYLMYEISDDSALKEIQKTFEYHSNFYPSKDFHLTLFHFGIPDEIYRELTNQGYSVDRDVYKSSIETLTQRFKNLESGNDIEIAIESLYIPINTLEIFDNNSLVARVEKNTKLFGLHDLALDYLAQFFRDLGLEDTEDFVKHNPNLKYQLDYTPHITLGNFNDNKYPNFDNFKPIRVQLANLVLKN